MKKHLIIGGTSKGGTTSIFGYFDCNPGVLLAHAKETRFFLDDNYPLPSSKRWGRDGASAYETFFVPTEPSDDRWRLEATPDYLYSEGTAERIRGTLPGEVRLVFILRDPISRLRSWYRFGRAMNEVPLAMSSDEWISVQRPNRKLYPTGFSHPAFAALQHGCYSEYLKPFVEVFGRDHVYICFYEDLKNDAAQCMSALCQWMGLPDVAMPRKSFEVSNRGVEVRNPRIHQLYVHFKVLGQAHLRRVPNIKKALGRVRRKADVLYTWLNTKKSGPVTFSDDTMKFLREYYGAESEALARSFGVHPNWPLA